MECLQSACDFVALNIDFFAIKLYAKFTALLKSQQFWRQTFVEKQ